MKQKSVILSWSSGKDAYYSLLELHKQSDSYKVVGLLSSVNAAMQRVSMHGISKEILQRQVQALGMSVDVMELVSSSTMDQYESTLFKVLKGYVDRGIDQFAYGDILLEDVKQYKEQQLTRVGGKGIFPVWKKDTRALLLQMIDSGMKAIVVCVDASVLDKSFLGRVIDTDFLNDLPSGVDPCGENGEYHSFVYDGPLFEHKVEFEKAEVVYKTYGSDTTKMYGFWFLDLV